MELNDFCGMIAASDVVVHPALYDSFGGTSMLARAYGKPLIASSGAGSARDIVSSGVNGWLYPPHEIQELSRLIDLLISDDFVRAQMSASMSAQMSMGRPDVVVNVLLTRMV